jgi:LysM repeat protein/proteasome lid subunit RPN8/RPN11
MKIDITNNPENKNLKSAEFPFDKKYIGSEETVTDEFKIFIRQETLKSVDDYLSGDLHNELGGVLVGDVCINAEGEQFIAIDNFIIARHTNSSISRLTFTHETWDQISETLEKDIPGKIILGWFHSHPGHTVFLSNYDLFIQDNFFNLEYMTAYVFDPVIGERGFFYKKESKIVRTKGFYLYDIFNFDGLKDFNSDKGKLDLKLKNPKEVIADVKDETSEIKIKSTYDKKNLIIVSLGIINLILLIFLFININELKQRDILKEDINKELAMVKIDNIKLKEKIDDLIVYIDLYKDSDRSDTLTAENNSDKQNENRNSISESKKSAGNESSNINSKSKNQKYTVKPGDSLEKIAIQFYKSKDKISILIKTNNLRNATDISPGQVLEIPE